MNEDFFALFEAAWHAYAVMNAGLDYTKLHPDQSRYWEGLGFELSRIKGKYGAIPKKELHPNEDEYMSANLGPYSACPICQVARILVKERTYSTWSRCDKCGIFRDSCNPSYYERKKDAPPRT